MGAPSSLSPKRSRFLSLSSKYRAGVYFVGGILAGVTICLVVFRLNGLALVSQEDLNHQVQLIADLQEENHELTDDLFNYREPDAVFDPTDLPYDESADARALVSDARQQASRAGKFLMITFGANWCMDCRTLHRRLKSKDVKQYTEERFLFVNVDVGKFNQNADLAQELGVTLSRGIPVAIFFDPGGEVIGTTNEGQLEPARRYTSKQILRFVRDIAERSQVTIPDSVSG